MEITERSLRDQLRQALESNRNGNKEVAMTKAELEKKLSDEKFERHFEAFREQRRWAAAHFENALSSVESEATQVFSNLGRQIEVLKEQKQAEDQRFEEDLVAAQMNRTKGVAALQQKAEAASDSIETLDKHSP